jgi:hypothetical protein
LIATSLFLPATVASSQVAGREPSASQITACGCVGTKLDGAQLVMHFVLRSSGVAIPKATAAHPQSRACARNDYIAAKRTLLRVMLTGIWVFPASKNGPTWDDVQ